jgi:hypothetical protein
VIANQIVKSMTETKSVFTSTCRNGRGKRVFSAAAALEAMTGELNGGWRSRRGVYQRPLDVTKALSPQKKRKLEREQSVHEHLLGDQDG